MNLKPIQFVILGVIVGFFMNNLYHASHQARAAEQVAKQSQSPFANCSAEHKRT